MNIDFIKKLFQRKKTFENPLKYAPYAWVIRPNGDIQVVYLDKTEPEFSILNLSGAAAEEWKRVFGNYLRVDSEN